MDSGESAYARYLDGDETAVGEIIRNFRDGLLLYINSFVRDLNAAEELCEDAFVKLFTKNRVFTATQNSALSCTRSGETPRSITSGGKSGGRISGSTSAGKFPIMRKILRKVIFARSAKKLFTRRCQSSKMNSGRCFG